MMSIRRSARSGLAAVTALFVLACSGTNDDGPAGNAGSIQVGVSPTNNSVQQGASSVVTVTLTRAGGFAV